MIGGDLKRLIRIIGNDAFLKKHASGFNALNHVNPLIL